MSEARGVYRAATGHRCGSSHHKARAPFVDVERARELREQGLSVLRIALDLGYPPDTIRDWVDGRTRISS